MIVAIVSLMGLLRFISSLTVHVVHVVHDAPATTAGGVRDILRLRIRIGDTGTKEEVKPNFRTPPR
jgi:hypothetical protein